MAPTLEQFWIPDALHFSEAHDGLTQAVIGTAAAEAELHLQGAHLAWWTPGGQQPVLFLSPKSLFVPGKAIRGGVPVIFPWFGDRVVAIDSGGKPSPAHGFARTMEWTVEATAQRDDGAVQIVLALLPNDVTCGFGYDGFELRYRVTIGSTLEMELETRNTGDAPRVFEEALHSYFAVGDVREVQVTGLEGTTYIDKTDGFKRKTLGREPFRMTKETDQVHLNSKATCMLQDPTWKRRIVVEKSGSDSTVVWNPWIDKTRGMSDMDPDGWRDMLCIETANAADNAVHLLPGESHKLAARIFVEEAAG
jgi:glucose-6-phosphate 1-epimerase